MVIEYCRLSISVVGVLYHIYMYYLLSILVRTTTCSTRKRLLSTTDDCCLSSLRVFFYARLYIVFIMIRVYCIIIILLSVCTSVSYGKLTVYIVDIFCYSKSVFNGIFIESNARKYAVGIFPCDKKNKNS